MKVNEALADALAVESDGPIFGLMGDANMPVWGALCKDTRTRMVWARHDGAAILMADGYAQATGKLGVVTVTCGPGLANGANALLSAARAGTPLVVFTGEYIDDGGKAGLQALDQRRFAAACEADFRPLARLDSLAEDIVEGFYAARTRGRPMILNMPQALWEAELPWDWDYQPSASFISKVALAPSDEALAEIVDALAAAERPVIVAGRGAAYAGARADLERLGDRVGALLATSLVAKGFFDGNPWDVGICGSFSSAPTEQLMAQADLVLGVGASLNFFTSEGGLLFPNARVARIDVKPYPATIGSAPGLYLQGDAKKTTRVLLQALEARGGASRAGFRSAASRDVLATPTEQVAPPTDGIDPRELMRALAASLPPRAQVVSGAGHFWSWPIAHLALPLSRFSPPGGGGAAPPPPTTILIEGDGSLLQGIQELHAAAEQRIPFIVLVMNDSGYGAEVLKMQWKKRDPRDAKWRSPDYVALARGFGAEGVRIDRAADLAGAIRQGVASAGPFVIDARISPTLVSDSYSRIFLGQPNRQPLLRPAKPA